MACYGGYERVCRNLETNIDIATNEFITSLTPVEIAFEFFNLYAYEKDGAITKPSVRYRLELHETSDV